MPKTLKTANIHFPFYVLGYFSAKVAFNRVRGFNGIS